MVPVDLRERGEVIAWVAAHKPDAVVHAAAYRDPDFCEREPAASRVLNVDSTQTLVDALPTDVPLLYISSDYVFDGKNPGYGENAARGPVNTYGEQKMASEDIVLARSASIVLRIPVLVGQDLPGKPGFITKMLESVASPEPIELDNTSMRFPTSIDDVAAAIRFLLEEKATGIFHASSTHGGTRYALNREVADFIGASYDHVTPAAEMVQRGATRPTNSQLDPTKIQALGFAGFRDLTTILAEINLG